MTINPDTTESTEVDTSLFAEEADLTTDKCKIYLCNKPVSSNGFCRRHYEIYHCYSDRLWNNASKFEKYLMSKYGLSMDQYKAILKAQHGKCPICKKDLGDDAVVDHCHATNRIRGLLHLNCNSAYGLLYENLEAFRGCLKYQRESLRTPEKNKIDKMLTKLLIKEAKDYDRQMIRCMMKGLDDEKKNLKKRYNSI